MERCYGAYKAFEYKPSEYELAAAKEEIAEKLKQYILNDAHWIIKGPGYLYNTECGIISADNEEYTIGFKITFDADVESVVRLP
jgi:hypothetical protein